MAFLKTDPTGQCPQIEVLADLDNNPTAGTVTTTDLTPWLVSYSRSPVRSNEFDQPGPAQAQLVFRNDDGRFWVDNSSGPYFGKLKKERRFWVRAGWGLSSGTLTVSGNEITDAARTAALSWLSTQQGGSTDGKTAPAGFGVWRAGTNLFRRGQCDTNADLNPTHATVTVDATTPAPFSPQSIKCVTDGSQATLTPQTATGLALAAGTSCAASFYVKAPVGATYIAFIRIVNTDASVTTGAVLNVTGTGGWQKVVASAVAVAAGKTGDQISVFLQQTAGRVETFWLAHPMIEAGVSYVSPYVATSGGATATRSAAQVQAPAALLDETQGWAAFRIAYGFDSTTTRTNNCYLLNWYDDAGDQISLWLGTGNAWNLDRVSAASGTTVSSAAQTFAKDDAATVVAAWDSGHVKISINGGVFVSVANTNIPALADALIDLGGEHSNTTPLNGRILWAALGTGTLTDTDAATFNSYGDNPPADPRVFTANAFWAAADSSYLTTDPAPYNRYFGYVTDWPQSAQSGGYDQTVTLTLTDALTPLTYFDLQGLSFPGTVSGTAIRNILDAAGQANYSLDTGSSQIVGAGTYVGTAGLPLQSLAQQRITDIAASENGVVFADGGGSVRFHSRHYRILNSATTMGTIGDAQGEIPYTNPATPMFGDTWNVINVTANGGTVESSTDTASTAAYFQRTMTFPPAGTYLVSSQLEAKSASQYILNRYKDPSTRIASVTLVGAANTALWPTILGLDTSTRVLFRRRFRNQGTAIGGTVALTQFVEGYGDQVTMSEGWTVPVALSPADLQSYWVLGNATYSILGKTTVLSY